ncbi:unnamed protein product, partial [Sphenostylis stenocarpa]
KEWLVVKFKLDILQEDFKFQNLLSKSPSSTIFLDHRDKLTVDKYSTLSLNGDKND